MADHSRTNRTANQTTFSYDTTATDDDRDDAALRRVSDVHLRHRGPGYPDRRPGETGHTTIEWADATASNEVTNTVRKVTQPTGEFVEYAYNANGYKTDEWDELRNHQTFEYA